MYSIERDMEQEGDRMKYFVVVKFVSDGKIKIWCDYDEGYCWNSPIYKVLGYAGTVNEAKNIKANGLEIE